MEVREVREVMEEGFVPTIEYFNAFETYWEEIQRIFDFENLKPDSLFQRRRKNQGLIHIHDVYLGRSSILVASALFSGKPLQSL